MKCRNCGAIFDLDLAVLQETEIPCPCGCESKLDVLLCPYCLSDDLTINESSAS